MSRDQHCIELQNALDASATPDRRDAAYAIEAMRAQMCHEYAPCHMCSAMGTNEGRFGEYVVLDEAVGDE
jgi:hypothetical protein